jgi:hypothetical protein
MSSIKSTIITERGLLLQEYSGKIEKAYMAAYFSHLYNNPEYLNVSNIFSDFTKAVVTFSDDEIMEVAYFIMTHAPKVRHVTNAIYVSEPMVTAYTLLYQEITREMPLYECKIFSTFEAAASYIDYTESELRDLINIYFEGGNK